MLLSRKLANSSVEIMDYPARKRKIHRNFDFSLPKFHFILPNFYFGPPWRIFHLLRGAFRFPREELESAEM